MNTQSREPDVITRRGKPVAVILPIKEYQDSNAWRMPKTWPISKRPAPSPSLSARSRITSHCLNSPDD